jgi:type I restriction enzyme, S subunit
MKNKTGYKNTEIGIIPDDWEVKSIKAITSDMLQGVNTAIDIPEYVESGYPILKANNIIDGEVNFFTSDHISTKTYQGYSDRFKIKKGDFLFSNIGARLGTGSLMKTSTECSFAWNVMRIIPNQSLVKPEFLGCIMNSPALFKEIKKNESGSGMGFVPKNVLQTLIFSIPKSLTEQTAIATALSDADALISGLEKLIAKKHNIKQGAMQKLLQPKEGWEKLGEIFTFYPTANYSKAEMSFNEEIGCMHYGLVHSISNPCFSLENGVKYYVSADKNKYELIKDGDIIMVDASEDLLGINKSVEVFDIRNKKFIAGLHTYLMRDENHILVNNIRGRILNSNMVKNQLLRLAVGMKVFGVSKTQLKEVLIPIPTPEEQTRIATILADMDNEITALETKLEKYKKVKLGMMQNLLTGKIRLV